MTNNEIKAARVLCASVKESECETCVCRDCLAEYHALDEIRDILPAALDALEAARCECDEARAEVERLRAVLGDAVELAAEAVDCYSLDFSFSRVERWNRRLAAVKAAAGVS